jgi:hypothetical protein
MEAAWSLLSTPLPAKYAAPPMIDQSTAQTRYATHGVGLPWEVWRMMGDLASRAASSEATTVEEEVT